MGLPVISFFRVVSLGVREGSFQEFGAGSGKGNKRNSHSEVP